MKEGMMRIILIFSEEVGGYCRRLIFLSFWQSQESVTQGILLLTFVTQTEVNAKLWNEKMLYTGYTFSNIFSNTNDLNYRL